MGNYVCQCITQQKNSLSTHKSQQTKSSRQEYSNFPSSIAIVNDIQKKSKFNTNDFEPKKFLGTGCYGNVAVVKKRSLKNHKLFAMKIIDKNMLKDKMLLHTPFLQNNIVTKINTFLVSVHNVFQNDKKTFIIMEYIEPQDLLFYIQKSKGLQEYAIKYIAAQILLGLKQLHKQGVVYGCLKSQNVLLSNSGHIKLTDYWFSKIKTQNKCLNFSGIIEYAAPEVLNMLQYQQNIDIWAFGILLYQMKYAKTPFIKQNTQQDEIKKSIQQGIYTVDQTCSIQLSNLISKLLSFNPSFRPTIKEIQNDPFFSQIDWDLIEQRQNPSPMQQIIKQYNTKSHHSSYLKPKRMFLTPQSSFEPVVHEFDLKQQND